MNSRPAFVLCLAMSTFAPAVATAAASAPQPDALSPPAGAGAPAVPSNGVPQLEQCKHQGTRANGATPYACVWMMGDGYAQILKTGDTSTAFGLGVLEAKLETLRVENARLKAKDDQTRKRTERSFFKKW